MQEKLDGDVGHKIKEKAHHDGKRTRNRKKKEKDMVENIEDEQPEEPIEMIQEPIVE
jgi:hypothetical protein